MLELQIGMIIIEVIAFMNTYIHQTNKRLRIRSDYIRDHSAEVEQLISQLYDIEAITEIKHKKYAGSVAISFDNTQISAEDILDTVESHHWLRENNKPTFIENAVTKGTKTFAKGVAVMALKRIAGPSVSRLLLSM